MFSIAMGANYSFELVSIVHWVPQFIGHNKIFLGSVSRETLLKLSMIKYVKYIGYYGYG